MPIGEDAQLEPAGIKDATEGFYLDEDILILSPDAKPVKIYKNDAVWSKDLPADARCLPKEPIELIREVPIPDDFIVSPENWLGERPNHAAAILLPDGITLFQTQPFSRCKAGGVATSRYYKGIIQDVTLYENGSRGYHGGSHLSSIGGTIRFGELLPGSVIQHALKIVLNEAKYLCYHVNPEDPDDTPGFRWPATSADSNAAISYKGENPELVLGSLLALKPTFDCSKLETEPAKIIALALINYGAYVVDKAGWDAHYLCTEWSPEGRVKTQLYEEWGFNMNESKNTAWTKDIFTIFRNLCVVINNTKDSVGGGGIPRQPLAPPFGTSSFVNSSGFCGDNNKCYTSMQEAINKAIDSEYENSLIRVASGEYLENVIIDKNVTLEFAWKSDFTSMALNPVVIGSQCSLCQNENRTTLLKRRNRAYRTSN